MGVGEWVLAENEEKKRKSSVQDDFFEESWRFMHIRLKQRALSENSAQVDDAKLAFKFVLQNLTNVTQIKHPL